MTGVVVEDVGDGYAIEPSEILERLSLEEFGEIEEEWKQHTFEAMDTCSINIHIQK